MVEQSLKIRANEDDVTTTTVKFPRQCTLDDRHRALSSAWVNQIRLSVCFY